MKNNLSAKKWSLLTLIVLSIVMSISFLFNYLIDPYGTNEVVCKNIYKPVLNERGKKYNYLFKENNIDNYDSLILGSSRVMQIVPSHFKDSKPYNFGVHVANNREKLFILKEWLKRKKLKKVYLGIDFYNFHILKMPLGLNTQKFYEYEKSYFASSAFVLSYKSIKNQSQNKIQTYFEKDGNLNYFNDDKMIKEGTFDFSKEKFKQLAISNVKGSYILDKFDIEQKVYDDLKEIFRLSKKYNFELIVFITPSHIEDMKLVQKNKELSLKFDSIRDNLVIIFGKVYDFSQDEKLNRINENFYDVVHYRSLLADQMIRRFEHSGDYGTLYSSDI